MSCLRIRRIIAALAFGTILSAGAANAAFINIDDSDPSWITITAGDFEGGFYVNGNLLTSGLGDSGSLTLLDGGYSISGSWIDLGLSSGTSRIEIALASSPAEVTSGIELSASTDGTFGTIDGSFGGYIGSFYFFATQPTVAQDGSTYYAGLPFLSIEFKSEAVPEPSTLLSLLGCALPAAVVMNRRRRASA